MSSFLFSANLNGIVSSIREELHFYCKGISVHFFIFAISLSDPDVFLHWFVVIRRAPHEFKISFLEVKLQ